jgi:hypothetical protein
MTQPSRAAVQIVGDVSRLGPQLERDAQRAINDVDLNTDNLSRQISDGFGEGVDDAITKLSELDPAVVLSSRNFVNRFQEAGDDVREVFDDIDQHFASTSRSMRRNSDSLFDDISDGAERAGEQVQEGLLRPLQRGFTNLGNLLGSAGTALLGIATTGTNPAGIAALTASLIAMASAIPVVIGLGAALADLAGLLVALPGIMGAAVASIAVITIAFQGFGDALSAIVEGDPEKIAEAMEKLAPAAQSVAREFQALLPLFRQVGDSIQQEFFEPLVGQLTIFGKTTLPALRNELDTLAQSIGRAIGHLGDTINEAQNVSVLERLLSTTSAVSDRLGASFARLGDSLFRALDASLPGLQEIGFRLAEAVDTFATWLSDAAEDGSLQEFFADALKTLDELLALGGAVGELLGTLFEGTDEGGRGFIGTLTDLTQRMTEFFKSAEGQEALQDFEEIIGAVGVILGFVVNAIRETIDIITELDDAVEAVIGFFSDLWQAVVDAWNGITSSTSEAAGSVGDFFSDLWEKIQSIWTGIVDGVSSAVDSVITFFTELPGRIWAAIQALPGLIAAALNAMIDQAISILAIGTAAVIVFFTDLPGQIVGAWNVLTEFLAGVWGSIVQTVTDGVNAAVAFVASLPERLAAIGAAIMTWAENTWNSVRDTVVNAWNAVLEFFSTLPGKIGNWFQQVFNAAVAKGTELVNWVKGIPGRILSALGNVGSMLYDAGAKIIQGLINGITSKINQLREKISSAVQMIRDHLPFSPAKTGPLSGSGSPEIAGAVIAEMVAAGLDAGTPLIAQAANRAAGAASPFGAIGQAGAAPLAAPGGPGSPSPVLSPVQPVAEQMTTLIVKIGEEEFEAYIAQRIEQGVAVEVRRLMAGTRG